ncbi:type II secretion system protein GspL [Legionella dresdenensis]|uniref:Type II secretion system protein L n=1 Tax=Legionella dresdenensis TaxID=450200 RepID=A0ABV8CGU5_9GAMM
MTTCYIFAKYLTEHSCQCIVLDNQNAVELTLADRHFDEIRQIQNTARTVIVLSCEHFSIHNPELPLLNDKKAGTVLPFALEENLAENLDDLHFAFSRNHYKQGRYQVAVCNKIFLADIISRLKENNLRFDCITVDWFALADGEGCLSGSGLLINDQTGFCGYLNQDFVPIYLKTRPEDLKIYSFADTDPALQTTGTTSESEMSASWIAKRLQSRPLLNLCRGEFAHETATGNQKIWYYAAAGMIGLWLLAVIAVDAIKIHQLNNKIAAVDQQIATIYYKFFPEAKQVISPRFRIEQFLKTHNSGTDNALWLLLNQLSAANQQTQSVIEKLRFQNQILQVSLIAKDFNTLETLQTALQKAQLKVKQSQAASRDQQVAATLELGL